MIKTFLAALFALFVVTSCNNPGNVDFVKNHADETFAAHGYRITGYQGYQWGSGWVFTDYGGACVWYQLETVYPNGITYEACLKRWGSEVHVYNLDAIDALRPSSR